ncbi:MAG: leucine-rich repeat domain-containing protein [Flexilinea sp.]|nr:leucine-rich repeat domain-containing protein [Flexilinea sp.]
MVKKITIALVILLMLAMVGLILVDRFDFSSYLHSRSENGNAVWNYEIEEGTVTLTAYLGRGDAPEIPEELDGIPVTRLGDGVFAGNTRIKEINIPDSILIEGKRAFENCTELVSVHISSVQNTIPERTFSGCLKLKNADLPHGLKSIGYAAFSGCTALSYFVIPDTVTSIGGDAFLNCGSLSDITISRNLNNIGSHAFRGTSWLSRQTDEFVVIGDRILIKYNGIAENVEVPMGITQITDAFEDNIFPIEIILPESLTSIGPHAFTGCRNLEVLDIPERVRSIGESAFRGCSHLNPLTLPEGLTQIGASAFQSCSALKRLLIPEGVKNLPTLAFANCENLRTLQIPQSVVTISPDIVSFSGIQELRVYKASAGEEFAEENKIEYSYMQQSTNDLIFQQMEEGVQVVLYTGNVYDVVIPAELGGDNVISLSDILFQHNTFVRSVSLPETITVISDYSFADMAELRSVKLPDHLEAIGSGAFSNDPVLGDLEIPSSVQEIADDAFWGCSSLVIVAEEGSYAYDWAIRSGIRVKDSKVIGTDLFKFVEPYGKVLISSYEGLERTPELPRFNEYGDFVTGIDDGAFRGNEISALSIPEGFETIGDFSFAEDPVPLEITIPRSITSIGDNCFEGTETVIYGYNKSYAEDYARMHKIKFLIIYEWES